LCKVFNSHIFNENIKGEVVGMSKKPAWLKKMRKVEKLGQLVLTQIYEHEVLEFKTYLKTV
jgi:hypothetical protein